MCERQRLGLWPIDKPHVEAIRIPTVPVKQPVISAASAQAAHRGIVWLHVSAIVVWGVAAAMLGALYLFGKPVPPAVVLIGFGAAAGHAIFLGVHLLMSVSAGRRVAP